MVTLGANVGVVKFDIPQLPHLGFEEKRMTGTQEPTSGLWPSNYIGSTKP